MGSLKTRYDTDGELIEEVYSSDWAENRYELLVTQDKLEADQQEIDRLTCENKRLTQHMKMQQEDLGAYTESPLGKRVAELVSENRALKELNRINEAVIQGKSEPLEFNDFPTNN